MSAAASPSLADLIIRTIKRALEPLLSRLAFVERGLVAIPVAPMLERLASLEARAATVASVSDALAGVRERIAVLETRAPVPGPPGKDGADGLGFDDLGFDYDNERTFTFRAVQGERRREFGTAVVPIVIYRGVWTGGTHYTRGDAVTLEGSTWHCKAATDHARPGTTEGALFWQLMVKRGDRGKDAR